MSPLREKTSHAVVAFDNMSDAMAFDATSKQHSDLPGRIIPVPREVDAGCGMSWAAPIEQRAELEDAIQRYNLVFASIHVVDLY